MGLELPDIVGTLDEMGLLEYPDSGEQPGPPDPREFEVIDIDWGAVDRPPPVGSEATQVAVSIDPWEVIAQQMNEEIGRGPYSPPEEVLDAYAWYLPFHYFWYDSGIYLSEVAIWECAKAILSRIPAPRRYELASAYQAHQAALAVLFLHEEFHHKVESFATRIEVVRASKVYNPYKTQVYRPLVARDDDRLMEESLACAEMIGRLGEPTYTKVIPADIRRATREWLHEWIPTLSAIYRRGADLASNEPYSDARKLMYGQIDEAAISPVRDAAVWTLAPDMIRGFLNVRRIAYVVIPIGTKPLIPWFQRYADPLSVSTRSARQALRVAGWAEVSGGDGSHAKFEKAGHRPFILPKRKDLSIGLQKHLARAVGAANIRDLASKV